MTEASQPEPWPQEPADPIDEISSDLSLASLPCLVQPPVAEALTASDQAHRAAWRAWLSVYESLPDSWSRFRMAVAGVLRYTVRAHAIQDMGNAAALAVTPDQVVNAPELLELLRETHAQYWAAVDALLENSAVVGKLLPAAARAELLQDWIVRLEDRVETLRHSRNAVVREAVDSGVSVTALAARLKVTRTAIRKMLPKAERP